MLQEFYQVLRFESLILFAMGFNFILFYFFFLKKKKKKKKKKKNKKNKKIYNINK